MEAGPISGEPTVPNQGFKDNLPRYDENKKKAVTGYLSQSRIVSLGSIDAHEAARIINPKQIDQSIELAPRLRILARGHEIRGRRTLGCTKSGDRINRCVFSIPTLPVAQPREKCIKLREYREGHFHEVFHEHIPAHKLAEAAIPALLQALVLRHKQASAREILQSYLTRRGRLAKTDHPLKIIVEYPEAAVIRRYCGRNVQAWIDSVTNEGDFRPSTEHKKS